MVVDGSAEKALLQTLGLTCLSPRTCPISSLLPVPIDCHGTPAAQPRIFWPSLSNPHMPAHYFVSPLLTGSMHSTHILQRRLLLHKDFSVLAQKGQRVLNE